MAEQGEKIVSERTFILDEDAEQYVGVTYGANPGSVKLPVSEGDEIIGVTQYAGSAGEGVSVADLGDTRVKPADSATWNHSAKLTVEAATGRFKEAAPGVGVTHIISGQALDALASGDTYGIMRLKRSEVTGT